MKDFIKENEEFIKESLDKYGNVKIFAQFHNYLQEKLQQKPLQPSFQLIPPIFEPNIDQNIENQQRNLNLPQGPPVNPMPIIQKINQNSYYLENKAFYPPQNKPKFMGYNRDPMPPMNYSSPYNNVEDPSKKQYYYKSPPYSNQIPNEPNMNINRNNVSIDKRSMNYYEKYPYNPNNNGYYQPEINHNHPGYYLQERSFSAPKVSQRFWNEESKNLQNNSNIYENYNIPKPPLPVPNNYLPESMNYNNYYPHENVNHNHVMNNNNNKTNINVNNNNMGSYNNNNIRMLNNNNRPPPPPPLHQQQQQQMPPYNNLPRIPTTFQDKNSQINYNFEHKGNFQSSLNFLPKKPIVSLIYRNS